MGTADKAKKGLECCGTKGACSSCPYMRPKEYSGRCIRDCQKDSLAYIKQMETERHQLLTKNQQLERERDAAVEDLKIAKRCNVCKHNQIKETEEPCFSCLYACNVNNFEWRGVKEADHEQS